MLLNFPLLKAARQQIGDSNSPQYRALQTLWGNAEQLKDQPSRTVMDKAWTAPSGDKHDYLSFGPYWWPNPDTPDGLPYVRRDGLLNPDTAQSDKTALDGTMRAVETLSLVYFYSGDESFAQAAAHRLRAWFLDPATRMNPHLEYGQAIPGHCEGRGIGIIDTATMRLLPDVLTLLEGSVALSKADSEAIHAWMARYLEWLLNSQHGQKESREHNNHGTWYDVQVALFALATEHGDVARQILQEVPTKRFSVHIERDGAQPHELARTRSFSYTCFNLTGFFDLATLGERVGMDLWHWQSAEGGSLSKALEFLMPFTDVQTPWPYPQVVADDRSQLLALLRRAKFVFPEGNWSPAIQQAEQISEKSAFLQLLWPS